MKNFYPDGHIFSSTMKSWKNEQILKTINGETPMKQIFRIILFLVLFLPTTVFAEESITVRWNAISGWFSQRNIQLPALPTPIPKNFIQTLQMGSVSLPFYASVPSDASQNILLNIYNLVSTEQLKSITGNKAITNFVLNSYCQDLKNLLSNITTIAKLQISFPNTNIPDKMALDLPIPEIPSDTFNSMVRDVLKIISPNNQQCRIFLENPLSASPTLKTITFPQKAQLEQPFLKALGLDVSQWDTTFDFGTDFSSFQGFQFTYTFPQDSQQSILNSLSETFKNLMVVKNVTISLKLARNQTGTSVFTGSAIGDVKIANSDFKKVYIQFFENKIVIYPAYQETISLSTDEMRRLIGNTAFDLLLADFDGCPLHITNLKMEFDTNCTTLQKVDADIEIDKAWLLANAQKLLSKIKVPQNLGGIKIKMSLSNPFGSITVNGFDIQGFDLNNVEIPEFDLRGLNSISLGIDYLNGWKMDLATSIEVLKNFDWQIFNLPDVKANVNLDLQSLKLGNIISKAKIRKSPGGNYGEIKIGDTGYVMDVSEDMTDIIKSSLKGTSLEDLDPKAVYDAFTDPQAFVRSLTNEQISALTGLTADQSALLANILRSNTINEAILKLSSSLIDKKFIDDTCRDLNIDPKSFEIVNWLIPAMIETIFYIRNMPKSFISYMYLLAAYRCEQMIAQTSERMQKCGVEKHLGAKTTDELIQGINAGDIRCIYEAARRLGDTLELKDRLMIARTYNMIRMKEILQELGNCASNMCLKSIAAGTYKTLCIVEHKGIPYDVFIPDTIGAKNNLGFPMINITVTRDDGRTITRDVNSLESRESIVYRVEVLKGEFDNACTTNEILKTFCSNENIPPVLQDYLLGMSDSTNQTISAIKKIFAMKAFSWTDFPPMPYAKIQILDNQHNILANTKVQIFGLYLPTDSEGTLAFRAPRYGDYTVRVVASGFEEKEVKFNVNESWNFISYDNFIPKIIEITLDPIVSSDLVLENKTVTDLHVYSAKQSITALNNFILDPPSDVTLVSGKNILLKHGFKALEGSKFKASIDPSLKQ